MKKRSSIDSIAIRFPFLVSGSRKRTWCSRPCGDQVMTSVSYEFRNMALVRREKERKRERERAYLNRGRGLVALLLLPSSSTSREIEREREERKKENRRCDGEKKMKLREPEPSLVTLFFLFFLPPLTLELVSRPHKLLRGIRLPPSPSSLRADCDSASRGSRSTGRERAIGAPRPLQGGGKDNHIFSPIATASSKNAN